MNTHLCVTVRWLSDRFHGFTDDKSGPEWPPSPFRLLQALVSGAYQHGVYDNLLHALNWIERQPAPDILAEHLPHQGKEFDHYVPDNDNLIEHKKPVMRVFRPVLLPERSSVTYVWYLDPSDLPPVGEIDELCSTLSTFGCGVDQAFASARLGGIAATDSDRVHSVMQFKHTPTVKSTSAIGTLRVPKQGTLAELNRVFQLNRRATMVHAERRKKRWPTVFDRIVYSGLRDLPGRPSIFFKLLDDELDTTRYPQPLLAHIAAVVRHAAIEHMRDGRNAPSWIPEAERDSWVSRFVRGKVEPGRKDHQQISYVPLPSIGYEHSDAMIRNVMLIAPIGRERELEHIAARLDGIPLEFKDTGEACDTDMPPRVPLPHSIQRFTPPRGRFIDKCYLGRSKVWQSVTPVILDEHIDKKTHETKDGQKIKCRDEEDFKRLIILALQRAGIETPCEFTWQTLPFYKNCLSAHRYGRNKRSNFVLPKRLDGKTAVHVRLAFEHAVPGPIAIGAGRHCGFGLFAAAESL